MRSGPPMRVPEVFEAKYVDAGTKLYPVRGGSQVLTPGWWVGVLHDDGTASFEQVEAPPSRIVVPIPYDPRAESLCPSCGSPGTEYHPSILTGRCHTCGFVWEFMSAGRTYGEHSP